MSHAKQLSIKSNKKRRTVWQNKKTSKKWTNDKYTRRMYESNGKSVDKIVFHETWYIEWLTKKTD